MLVGWLCFIKVMVILIKFVFLIEFRINCFVLFIMLLMVIMLVNVLEISMVIMMICVVLIFVYFVVVFDWLNDWIL